LTILIVDDDHEFRTAVAHVLVSSGHVITEARQGLEALRLLRAGLRPAVILLDLMMPVMDGFQFLKERARDPALADLPVIVMSASYRRPALPYDFLGKPASLDAVFAAIAKHCPPGALPARPGLATG
jgi:CheY-like chemotaxis protein